MLKLTSMHVKFISDLPVDLSRGDVLLPIKCVRHIQLLVLNKFSNNFYAISLRQPVKISKVVKVGSYL